MKTIKTSIAAIAVFFFGAINPAGAEEYFGVYVDDIWEHKVIITARVTKKNDLGFPLALNELPNWVKENMDEKIEETAEFACELYDRIAVPLSSWETGRKDDLSRVAGSYISNHLYACATEDPY